jgi:hypothetical protein
LTENPSIQPQAEVPPSHPEPAAVNKSRGALESVDAEVVQLSQSRVNSILANSVSIREGIARQVNAQTVTMTNSGIGVMHASSINITNGGSGIVSAEEAKITGNVGVMIGQSVHLNNHRTILFLAGKSDAPVETILDQRSVALFGLTLGIAMGLVLSIFRLLKHS